MQKRLNKNIYNIRTFNNNRNKIKYTNIKKNSQLNMMGTYEFDFQG